MERNEIVKAIISDISDVFKKYDVDFGQTIDGKISILPRKTIIGPDQAHTIGTLKIEVEYAKPVINKDETVELKEIYHQTGEVIEYKDGVARQVRWWEA